MKRLEHHPISKLFPMLSDAQIDDLSANITAQGVRNPVVLLDGKILDGRNRDEAGNRAKVSVPTVDFYALPGITPVSSPTEWVLSQNLHRRHLNESQRAIVAMEAEPLIAAEAAARQKAGKKLPELAPAPLPPRGGSASLARRSRTSSAVVAKAVGASARSVERAKFVATKRPDLAQLVRDGKKSLKQVEKTIRKEEATKNVLVYRPPVGTFSVIVADPSWKFDDELDGSDQARGGVGYPPQTEEEICAMQIGKNQAARDCALWLWVTNTHLINGAASRVLDAWGFVGKSLYTWRKVDKAGNDRLGTGRYGRNVTEHVILAVRGKPVVDADGQANIFDAPRGKHSEKPARFFEIAEKVTPCAPEARIELFAITDRKGWMTSGSEQQAKAKTRKRKLKIKYEDEASA